MLLQRSAACGSAKQVLLSSTDRQERLSSSDFMDGQQAAIKGLGQTRKVGFSRLRLVLLQVWQCKRAA